MDTLRSTYFLTLRNLRIRLRPQILLPSLVISTFLFVAFGYAFGSITSLPGFPAQNYLAYLTPFILIQSMVFSGGDAGFGVLTDILSGYFEKLLMAPINRFSILFSTLFTASIRALVQVIIIVIIAFLLGVTFATGIPGAVGMILFAATFGVAWSCLGIIIALRTKSAEVTQSFFVLFFPVVFLTTGFIPKSFLPGWFQAIVTINPVTYVLDSVRAMAITGWDAAQILPGLWVTIGLTLFLIGLTLWFFRRATA